MTKDELQKLDNDLAEEERTLTDQLNRIADKNPEAKDDFVARVPQYDDADNRDEDDYAHEVSDFDRNVALEQELETRLREVRKTREKIKSGNYGKCENCSQDIQEERLKVMPVASLCMSCAKGK